MLRIIMLMMTAFMIVSGCGNVEETEAPVESEEAAQSEEGTETEEAQIDGDSMEEEQTEAETEPADSEQEEDAESESESTGEASENTEESESAATEFDIKDSATQESLLAPTYPEEGLTFEQDVITEGMTQAEVEDLHGEYDFIYPGHGRAVTIYNNLGVIYSLPGPYGDDELATTDVNPDEVIVENVMFYAGSTYDEVVSALGEPDVDAYEPEEGPVSGYHFMEYVLDAGEETELAGVFWMHEDENGQLMVDVMTKNEQPIDVDQYNESIGELDEYTEETLTAMVEGYLSSLEDYYNDENEDVFDYTEPSSENGQIISSNKESGNFSNHENHNIEILNMEEQDSTYYITASRQYSHATSDGVRETTVQYEVFNTTNGFKVMSFEELNDESAN